MLVEISLLNKLYKSKDFSRIKPRVTLDDTVVYVTTSTVKSAELAKLNNEVVCLEIHKYFGISGDTITKDKSIYLDSELHFACQCIELSPLEETKALEVA